MKKTLMSLAVIGTVLGLTNPVHSATISFKANLDAAQVVSNPNSSSAKGLAKFVLNSELNQLSYVLSLDGLDLKPVLGNRTEFNDVNKIHLHAGASGQIGPHVLNVFGLPSEDDQDLVVDFKNENLSGIWDDGDAIDPLTGQAFDQTVGGTTKFLSNFIEELKEGNLYLAVHTAGFNGGVAIRGQIERVPEPSTLLSTIAVATFGLMLRKRKSQVF